MPYTRVRARSRPGPFFSKLCRNNNATRKTILFGRFMNRVRRERVLKRNKNVRCAHYCLIYYLQPSVIL